MLRVFYPTEKVKVVDGRSAAKIEGKLAVGDIVYPADSPRAGEILVECGQKITKNAAELICTSGLKEVEVMADPKNPLLLNALAEDTTASHEEALLRIYQRLRPGNPPQLEKAKALFHEKFFDTNRYRLGRVGRFRINRKLGLNIPEDEMTLRPDDLIAAIHYLVKLRANDPAAEIDDIDHLGNRRLRTIDELASDELRKGFLKLRRTVQERMSLKDIEDMTPRSLVNPKSISAAIEYFFGRGELSQVVDQTNPLSMLTHERRLSALGPGGLNRKRAGFEVRDVHISHYGRICPIETPEGTNIGLISSLAIYAGVDEYGFLVTPYQKVKHGKLTNEIEWLRADQEHEALLAPADTPIENGQLVGDTIIARHHGDFTMMPVDQVQYVDVAPSQMVGVSAGLIPFLEHDDANRALMGSNMQRQAVPLLITEPPLVATGLEVEAAQNSSMLVRAWRKGTVTYVDARRIEIDGDVYQLRKFVGLNERTCQNQKPIVALGDKVEKGQIIADGPPPTTANWPWDATCWRPSWPGTASTSRTPSSSAKNWCKTTPTPRSTSRNSTSKSARPSWAARNSPATSPTSAKRCSATSTKTASSAWAPTSRPGDILVGKVSPKSKTELTPEEKLLHAIFGLAGEDVKNDSLEVPSGVEGIVIDTQKFSRRMSLSEDERKAFENALKEAETAGNERIAAAFGALVGQIEEVLKKKLTDEDGKPLVEGQEHRYVAEQAAAIQPRLAGHPQPAGQGRGGEDLQDLWPAVEAAIDARDRRLNSMKRGDELRSGVLQMVKVYVAAKRVISVGDKMAGRHGNKGVIAKILPQEDMPFLADGTPGANPAEPAGRAQPYERGPDSGDALGLGGGRSWASRRSRPFSTAPTSPPSARPWTRPACPSTARPNSTTAGPASRSSSFPRWATST